MARLSLLLTAALLPPALLTPITLHAQEQLVRVDLAYRAPVDGQPKPNFSPKGTQVPLADIPPVATLPPGATRPAKYGLIPVGPSKDSYIPVLATSSVEFPNDLVRLYVDRNRNGDWSDDGGVLTATPAQNAKTRAWWSSINKVEIPVSYGSNVVEPYFVNFWMVREDSAAAPDILRYSVGSWRYGTARVNGVDALVAAMDGDNNALFGKGDSWSVIAASDAKAEAQVLSSAEARSTNRFMFLPLADKELVLEFRSMSADGRSMEFAVVDRAMTKAADRAPDDLVMAERPRPRAQIPFVWGHTAKDYTAALSRAKQSGRYIFLDFETTWCGPCHTMDQWIWTDADVAAQLNAGYIGVKLDGDIEKELVKKYKVSGYPTMVILDSAGTEVKRIVSYASSKEMLEALAVRK